MLLRSPPRLNRAVPGVSEAASAPLASPRRAGGLTTDVAAPRHQDGGEVFNGLLMSLEQTVAPGVTRPSLAPFLLVFVVERVVIWGWLAAAGAVPPLLTASGAGPAGPGSRSRVR